MNRGCLVECPRCAGRGYLRGENSGQWVDCPICWSEGFDGLEPVGHIALPIAPAIANDREKATWVDMYLNPQWMPHSCFDETCPDCGACAECDAIEHLGMHVCFQLEREAS